MHAAAFNFNEDVREVFSALVDCGLSVNSSVATGIFSRFEDNGTPLAVAAMENNGDALQALLDLGATTGGVSVDSAMYTYAVHGDTESIDQLLNAGASIALPGDIAIHTAAVNDQINLVEHLVDEGAPINNLDECRQTPLHWACANSEAATIRRLIELGANVHAKDERSFKPLHQAARTGNLEAIDILVERGAKVNSRCRYGITPICAAAGDSQTMAVYKLFNYGANIDETPALTEAINAGSAPGLAALLELGASVNFNRKCNSIPLHTAATATPSSMPRNGAMGIPTQTAQTRRVPDKAHTMLCMLLDNGADVDAQMATTLRTALHEAQRDQNSRHNSTTTTTLVDANLGSLEIKDSIGRTPLVYAAVKCQNKVSFEELLDSGANVHATTLEGFTALHECARQADDRLMARSVEFIDLLVLNNADVNAKSPLGVTPLHLAAAANNRLAIRALVAHGAQGMATTIVGHTPLHFAFERARVDAIEELVNLGCYTQAAQKMLRFANPNRHSDTYRRINRIIATLPFRHESGLYSDSDAEDDDNAAS